VKGAKIEDPFVSADMAEVSGPRQADHDLLNEFQQMIDERDATVMPRAHAEVAHHVCHGVGAQLMAKHAKPVIVTTLGARP